MKKTRVVMIVTCLICFILINSFILYQVKAESNSAISTIECGNSDLCMTTQTDLQQSTDIINSTEGSTDNDVSDDSQTSEDDQEKKEGEKKDSDKSSLFSVFLGGLIALAGSVITSLFNSREASKQREFQLTIEAEARKEENNKELYLYKRKAYTDYIQSLRNLNRFIISISNPPVESFEEYQKEIITCNACIMLVGSKDVMCKADDISASVRYRMNPIPEDSIMELIKLMREDIKQAVH